jgi:hypothetical protein
MSGEPAKDWVAEDVIPLPVPIPVPVVANYPKPPPTVRRLLDLKPAIIDDPNTLLGNRFLCRGGGALLVGSSGIGKSTLVIQMCICWAVGRECFGIKPHGALKILYIQAENDEGDLCEMRDGALKHLGFTNEKEHKTLEENFVCVFESARTGFEFITQLELLLKEHSPDLLVLDPALSYIGGNANEQETVGRFLRNGLNPLLQKYKCGALIVHHTNKPNAKGDDSKKLANDYAYAGTGSAEWANWARAVVILSAKDDYGVRELRIGKRFRLGWKDADLMETKIRLLRQSSEGNGLFYTELSALEAIVFAPSKVSPLRKVLGSDVLPKPGEEVEKNLLIARAAQAKICGRDRMLREVIPLLIDKGYLKEKEVPRSGARPAIHLERTNKMPGNDD